MKMNKYRHILVLGGALTAMFLYMHYTVTYGELNYISGIAANAVSVGLDVAIVMCVHNILLGRRQCFIWPTLILAQAYTLANVWYSRVFDDYMPFSAWFQVQNLHGLGNSIAASTRWYDFVLAAIIIASAYAGIRHCKPTPTRRKHTIFATIAYIGVYFIFSAVFILHMSRIYNKTWTEALHSEASQAIYSHPTFAFLHGSLVTIAVDAMRSNTHINLTEAQRNEIDGISHGKRLPTIAQRPRRLIFVIIESLIDEVIGKKSCGQEVTPTLNRLSSNGLYYSRMESQIHSGNSSDGQFIYFTGLLPMCTGITVYDYCENVYHGLGTAAKEVGMTTVLVNPCTHDYWMQDTMCERYGIEEQLSVEQYEAHTGLTASEGTLNDEEIFNYAKTYLANHRDDSLFMTILTMSTHYPYTEPFDASSIKTSTGNSFDYYMQKISYTDRVLGSFIEWMEENGLTDGTAIAIASDHHAPTLRCRLDLPFIVVGEGIEQRTCKDVVGQTDVYPTILGQLGHCTREWIGTGHSLLDKTSCDEHEDNRYDHDKQQRWSELIIQGNYFNAQQKTIHEDTAHR